MFSIIFPDREPPSGAPDDTPCSVNVVHSCQVATPISRLSTPPPSAEAVNSYGAGARSPLKSKVPTAVSTLHVTTGIAAVADAGRAEVAFAEAEHDEDCAAIRQSECRRGCDPVRRRSG